MKFLRNSVLTLLIVAAIIVIAGLLVQRYYGDAVKGAVIERLNERLEAEVEVDAVSFSVLRKFPYASVELSRVKLQERGGQKDTLFHFDQVFLQFDLFDVFRGEQRIERISFEEGRLDLTIDRNGDHPYQNLWKTDPDRPDTASSAFELERVEWEDVRFEYRDLRTGVSFDTQLSYAFLQASFDASSSELRTRIEGEWDSFSTGDRGWKKLGKRFSVQSSGRIEQNAQRISIEKGELVWQGLNGSASGSIIYGNDARLDLRFEFPFQRIRKYLEAWPELSMPEGYELGGSLRLAGEWKGRMEAGPSPVISSEFKVRNGRITHKSSGIGADELKGAGSFTTSDRTGRFRVALDSFRTKFGGGDWKGRGSWSIGPPHSIEFGIKGQSDLQRTTRFLGIDTLRSVEGNWTATLKVEGEKRSLGEWDPEDLRNFSIDGRAELKNATFALKGKEYRFGSFDGTFLLADRDAAVKDLSGKVMGTDLHLNGRFYDLIPYLFFPDEKLRVDAELRSERIDLDQLLSKEGETEQVEGTDYELKFPKRVHLSLDARVAELEFRHFQAEELEGVLELGPGGFQGRNISLRTAGGRIEGDLAVNGSTKPYGLRADAQLTEIRIGPLFRSFENFGQKLVRSEHLKGELDAKIHYSSSLEPNLGIPPGSVHSKGDLELRKGELIEFQPLIDLGDRLASKKVLNAFLELERLRNELEHVQFQTLSNQLRIENEELIIPRFDVRSNALDITASGTHSFDGRIDHHFTILMDELLSKPKKSEFGYLRDEGEKKRLFVKMEGSSEDPEIGLDRGAAKEYRQERREDEKEDIKDALRKEFGLFEKDSTDTEEGEKDPEEKKGKPVFDVQWGDDKEKKEKEEPNAEKKSDQGKSIWERLGIGDDEDKKEEQKR